VDDGIRQWIATDIAALRVPLQELEVGDEYAMSVTASKEIVSVGHVYHGSTFDAVLVTCVEADIVVDVEFPQTLVVLWGKAE
jgi:hypothetical protein